MTFYESVHHFYEVWLSRNTGLAQTNVFWRFSSEGWRAYHITKPKQNPENEDKSDPINETELLQIPVEIIEDHQFWFDLIVQGIPVKIQGRFPFNKASILQ